VREAGHARCSKAGVHETQTEGAIVNHLARRLVATGTAVALCLPASIALGGAAEREPVTVEINPGGVDFAIGSLVGARYSSDSTQYIGCDVHAVEQQACCFAQSSTGQYLSCCTTQPQAVQAVLGINETSIVDFETAPNGSCVDIGVINFSSSLP
jgi:hypothetical protein